MKETESSLDNRGNVTRLRFLKIAANAGIYTAISGGAYGALESGCNAWADMQRIKLNSTMRDRIDRQLFSGAKNIDPYPLVAKATQASNDENKATDQLTWHGVELMGSFFSFSIGVGLFINKVISYVHHNTVSIKKISQYSSD